MCFLHSIVRREKFSPKKTDPTYKTSQLTLKNLLFSKTGPWSHLLVWKNSWWHEENRQFFCINWKDAQKQMHGNTAWDPGMQLLSITLLNYNRFCSCSALNKPNQVLSSRFYLYQAISISIIQNQIANKAQQTVCTGSQQQTAPYHIPLMQYYLL